MKTINLLVLSLLLANSAEALAIKESQANEVRTIGEALQLAKSHQKHKHHHHHESDSDSDELLDIKKTGGEAFKKSSLAQEAIEVIEQSKGTPQEDKKMREFINNMKEKDLAKATPTTVDYRLKAGIAERPAIDPTEAVHVVKQAEAESRDANATTITQEQIKPVGGKDQKPDYENKNAKTLIDAHNNNLDMNGNEPKAPAKAPAAEEKIASPATPSASQSPPVLGKISSSAADAKPAAPAAPAAPVAPAKAPESLVQQKETTQISTGLTADGQKNFENTLQEILALHNDSVDLLTADSSFHKLSHLSDPEKDYRTLDKTMAEMAYLDVLDKFDLSMTDDEEKSFYKNHFEPAWAKYSDGTTLDYDKTPGFFQMLKKRVV